MRQVLQDRSGRTRLRDVPPPPCPERGVLVRTLLSAISSGTERSRLELSQKSLIGKARERPDLVAGVIDKARREGVQPAWSAMRRALAEETPVGYSAVGEVIEVGPRVSGIDPGDVVACAGAGFANHAEIVAVPRNLCAQVPEGVSLRAASMATIAAVALHGLRLSEVQLGDSVGVVGCGLVGRILCQLLWAAGARTLAFDIDAASVAAARANGADEGCLVGDGALARVRRATAGRGVDHVIVTAAAHDSAPLLFATEIARDRATIVVVGDVRLDVPRAPLYEKELSFRVSRSYGPGRYDRDYEERGLDYPLAYVRWTEGRNLECVLDLLARGRLDLDRLVDVVVPVADAASAYARLTAPRTGRPGGAILLDYASSTPGRPGARPRRERPARRATRAGSPRVGLVGPGSFATKVLVPALVAAGARLELVGGGLGPSAEAAYRRLGFARVAPSAEAVIADATVEAVVIATRHADHASLAAGALAACKHVFCEKPLALTHAELDAVLRAADGSGAVLAVGFNRRFSALLVQMRSFLAEADAPMTLAFRVSAGALRPDHWVHDADQGGGRMLGEICHFVDCFAYLSGEEIAEVSAVARDEPGVALQARDNVVVTLAGSEGSVGTITYVSDGSPRLGKERIEAFSGSRSSVLEDFRLLRCLGGPGRGRHRLISQEKGHRAEIAAFVRAVRSGREPVPLAAVENVTRATLAALDALRTGRKVALGTGGAS